MSVGGPDAPTIGHTAFVHGVELHELTTRGFDLEELFFQLTAGGGEHGGEHQAQPVGPLPGGNR